MVSAERIKEIYEDKDMSDEEAVKIRDGLTTFVRSVFDQWILKEINN